MKKLKKGPPPPRNYMRSKIRQHRFFLIMNMINYKKRYMFSFINKYKAAFTLAEVLITLGIIGIVAAMTIPTIIQNYKKQVTVNQLKASYSLLSQAVSSSKEKYGDISTWDFDLDNSNFANTYILPHLKVVKTISTLEDKSYWRLNCIGTGAIFTSWPWDNENAVGQNNIYILSNGSAITVSHFLNLQMRITVDINGAKGPNIMGIDGFVFYIDESQNQLLPVGNQYDRNVLRYGTNGYSCSKDNKTGYYSGSYCAALIMRDGWKISNDYPWQ